jgi:HNH endonuclease
MRIRNTQQSTGSTSERFLRYVRIQHSGCWIWTGGRSRGKGNKKWYGSFWAEGKTWRAHIWSARFLGGLRALKRGEHYDHTCNNSLCVNYHHLEIVTNQENTRRKVERRNEHLCRDRTEDQAEEETTTV